MNDTSDALIAYYYGVNSQASQNQTEIYESSEKVFLFYCHFLFIKSLIALAAFWLSWLQTRRAAVSLSSCDLEDLISSLSSFCFTISCSFVI